MEFIFDELMDKARGATYAKDALKMHSDRGAWTLLNDIKGIEIPTSIMVSVSEDVEYDRSILMWHIATDLLFFTSIDINNKNRKWCKLLSDYLLYLLIMRSTMMSSVTGIAQIRFYDTCAEAKKLFSRQPNMKEEREVCEILLSVNTNVKHEANHCYSMPVFLHRI
ncbi:hypothetical protein ACH5RR_037738 [Cinchona calisaya]|uniref:Uncharacterized protein n=1 Tax=Cinchona calisaya TaxID=153742 RepID=A0ABD2YAR6_9GENT